jgi:NADH dehydrogenase
MIRRSIDGKARTPFKYFHKGDLATIGRHKAVSAFGRFTVTGYLSWLIWVFVHLMYLVGFRNRVTVFVQWAYAYLTYQRGVRLIAGTWYRRSAPDASPDGAVPDAQPSRSSRASSAV